MPRASEDRTPPWGRLTIDLTGQVLSLEAQASEVLPEAYLRHITEIEELRPLWQAALEMRQRQEPERTLYLKVRDRFFKVFILRSPEGLKEDFEAYLVDVTEFYEAQEELKERNRQIIALNTIITAFLEKQEEDPYGVVLEKVLLALDFDGGMIVFRQGDEYHLLCKRGIIALAEHINEDWFIDLLPKEHNMLILDEEIQRHEHLKKEGFEIFVVMPVVVKGAVRGWFCLGARKRIEPEFDLVTFLNLLGAKLSLLLERQVLYEEVRELSLTDPLTGLRNVRYFYDTIEREVKRASRYGEVFSVVIFDIDNFKDVNDTYGHQTGDDVLKELAGILKGQCRRADVLARYGGEEFVMLLPRTDRDSALQVAERIREAVQRHTFSEEALLRDGMKKALKITISGGVATFPEDGQTVRELLYRADMALYRAKALGKARVECWKKEEEDETGI